MLHFLKQLFTIYSRRSTITSRQVKNYIERSQKAVQEQLLKQKQQRIKELQQGLRQQQHIDPQTRVQLRKELERLQQQRKTVSGTTKPSPKAW